MWETKCDFVHEVLFVKTGSDRLREHEVDREREICSVRVILH